jgi:4-aminobutyrate aminotransferase-like enzyme
MLLKQLQIRHLGDKFASPNPKGVALKLSAAFLALLIAILPIHSEANRSAQCPLFFSSKTKKQVKEVIDFGSEWGVKLFSDLDPMWSDPAYLKELKEFAAPTITHYDGRADTIYDRFINAMSVFAKGSVAEFTTTGTAANNLLFEYAHQAYRERTGREGGRVNLLSFEAPYGGMYGRIGNYHHRVEPKFEIPTPKIIPGKKYSRSELAEIIKIEEKALKFIRNQVAKRTLEIGGIFMEPISVAQELFVYRTEFMLKLRKLADELGVPIFCDEILTGGGRTGKFWAYQHYKGFTPDVVTFGKGLVVSGVFLPNRAELRNGIPVNPNSYFETSYGSTTSANPLALLQGVQVLETIQKRNLLSYVEEIGRYFYKKLKADEQAKKKRDGFVDIGYAEDTYDQIRGVGLLLWAPTNNLRQDSFKYGYNYRLLPPLTITKKQIDDLFEK